MTSSRLDEKSSVIRNELSLFFSIVIIEAMINSPAEEFKWPPVSINIHRQTSINVEHNN